MGDLSEILATDEVGELDCKSSTSGNAQMNENNESRVPTTVPNSRDRTVAAKFPKSWLVEAASNLSVSSPEITRRVTLVNERKW